MITCKQTSYADLDIKTKEVKFIDKRMVQKPFLIASRYIDLLEFGYRKYLHLPFDRSKVIVGDGCRGSKISFHVIYYDHIHCWRNGICSENMSMGQKSFIQLLNMEIMRNLGKWQYLHFQWAVFRNFWT